MTKKRAITVAHGDGIGPEIMAAVLAILEAAGAPLDIETIEIGEKSYLAGEPTGMAESAWESIRRTRVLLKAPITTPQGGGYRSLNVAIRSRLGLYANIRPCRSYYPFVETKHPKMDLVIVRENAEDLYTGTEYQQTEAAAHAIKVISRTGCERILRYAFAYAEAEGRHKVSCFTKDNILKKTDGLFHHLFEEIGAEYPHLEREHWIVDIGMAKVANHPELFDVLVLPNLYGDILSDITAELSGSVGLGGSANVGLESAMFEAVHGSAPRRAGKNQANPSGLLLAAVMMLHHLHYSSLATTVHNAWLKTLEEGVHTVDLFSEGISKECVGTREFAQAIIARLGESPSLLAPMSHHAHPKTTHHKSLAIKPRERLLVGVDCMIHSEQGVGAVRERIAKAIGEHFRLERISNRGTEVWPVGFPETETIPEWNCRFLPQERLTMHPIEVPQLLHLLVAAQLEVVRLEYLYTFDHHPGFSG